MFDDILPIGYIQVDGIKSYFMPIDDKYVGMHMGQIEGGIGYAYITVCSGLSEKFDNVIPIDVRIHKRQLEDLCRRLNFSSTQTSEHLMDEDATSMFIELFETLIEENQVMYVESQKN